MANDTNAKTNPGYGFDRLAPQLTAKKALASVKSIVSSQKQFVKNQAQGIRKSLHFASNNSKTVESARSKSDPTAIADLRQSLKFSPNRFVTRSLQDFEKHYERGEMLGTCKRSRKRDYGM
jgi:hypothetical protein